MKQEDLDKIREKKLVHMVSSESDDRASVLLELDLPLIQIEVVKRRGRKTPRPRDKAVGEADDVERQVTKAKVFLSKLLGREPTWLGAARAFVATVDGRQLRQIAASPLIRAIHANRRLR